MKPWFLIVATVACLVSIAHVVKKVVYVRNAQAFSCADQSGKRKERWWSLRHAHKVERIKQGEVDLLMIGDSITHSWEDTGRAIWKKYYEPRNVVNLGFGGDRTEHVKWRLENGEIDRIAPKLAVLLIGTNNTGLDQCPPQDTAAGINAIINELRTRLPETKILLLAIFPRGVAPDDTLRKVNDEVNTMISDYADNQNVFYLDINKKFLDQQGNLRQELIPDLLHLNEKGYQIWAEAMEPMMRKLLNEEHTLPN